MVCCQVPVQNQRGSLKVSLTVRHRHVHMQVCIKLVDAVVAQADTTAQISSHAFCFKITGFVFSRVVFGPRIAKKFQKHIGTAPTAIPFSSASFRETSQHAKPVFIYIIAKLSQGQFKEVKVQSQSVVAGQLCSLLVNSISTYACLSHLLHALHLVFTHEAPYDFRVHRSTQDGQLLKEMSFGC